MVIKRRELIENREENSFREQVVEENSLREQVVEENSLRK